MDMFVILSEYAAGVVLLLIAGYVTGIVLKLDRFFDKK